MRSLDDVDHGKMIHPACRRAHPGTGGEFRSVRDDTRRSLTGNSRQQSIVLTTRSSNTRSAVSDAGATVVPESD
jgi:hypothetical protein